MLDQYFSVRSALKARYHVPPEVRMRENVGITHLGLVHCLVQFFLEIRTLSRRTSKSCSCGQGHRVPYCEVEKGEEKIVLA